MNLKKRFSIIFSCLFSLLLGSVMIAVYYLFAEFRTEEFADRLAEKAETTAKLLIVVKEIDYNLQKIIDRNSINRMYREHTEIFDEHEKIIYNSNDSTEAKWPQADFERVLKNHRFHKKNGRYDVVGLYFSYQNHFYYVFISAEDTFRIRKLAYLKYMLVGAFLIGTLLVWLLSLSLSQQILRPLDDFRKQIQDINDNDLSIRLSTTKQQEEINELARSFNQMMDRIDFAYKRQREFTGNASHELRTPIARITAQLENLLHKQDLPIGLRENLRSISEDTFQLSEIVSSLVALTHVNNSDNSLSFKKVRLDETVFAAAVDLSAIYTDFKLKFEIENKTNRETDLEIPGDDTLLKIVLLNLFKNAYIYSDNHNVECLIRQKSEFIELIIINTGEVPDIEDTSLLFTAFYRGSNANKVPGSGIGLSIVRRVLQYHQATIGYQIIDSNTNMVLVTFRKPNNPLVQA